MSSTIDKLSPDTFHLIFALTVASLLVLSLRVLRPGGSLFDLLPQTKSGRRLAHALHEKLLEKAPHALLEKLLENSSSRLEFAYRWVTKSSTQLAQHCPF